MSKALAKGVWDASVAVNNHADLIAIAARMAKEYAYEADESVFPKFHEIRLILDGAERLMRDTTEVLDELSAKVGALKAGVLTREEA